MNQKRRWLILSMTNLAVILSACIGGNQSVPQDGVVKFTADGQSFSFSEMQLEIQPNQTQGLSAVAMHKEVTPIQHGKTDFGFEIRTTQERAAREAKAFNDYMKSGQSQRPDPPGLSFSWWQETANPFEYFRSGKISVERDPLWDVKIPATQSEYDSRSVASSPGRPPISQNDLWIQFDEVSDSRVKGHFGGTLYAKPLPATYPPQERNASISGEFDLPVVKLYKYD